RSGDGLLLWKYSPQLNPSRIIWQKNILRRYPNYLFPEEAISSHEIPRNSSCLASDFKPEEVWIGHSYFITDKEGAAGDIEIKTKMKYEVLPLIKEYVKDGILYSDQGNSDDPVQKVVNELSQL